MRTPLLVSVVAAGLLLVIGVPVKAQEGNATAGQARGGRGGFGGFGGQMGQRVEGTVTAASGDKLTIKTEAGDIYEVTVSDNSRIVRDRQQIKLSEIKPGDMVTAAGQVDAAKKTVQATMVMDVDAAAVAKAKENMGKTYITGRVTAIDADNLKLTVMRTDDVSQVIAVDEGTSFERGMRGVEADVTAAGGLAGGGFGGGRGMGGGRRQGGGVAAAPPPESITLADIKVGDSLMATGAVKNGVFTALKMGVSEPGAERRGAPGEAGPQGPGPADAGPQPPPPPQ